MAKRKVTLKMPQGDPGPRKPAKRHAVVRGNAEGGKPVRWLRLALWTKAETNGSRQEHWATKRRRVNAQREYTRTWCRAMLDKPALPCVVRLVRLSPGTLDVGDNLPSAMKAVRDGIADWLGVDDGPKSPITFEYDQERCAEYWVRVEVNP